MLKAVGFDYSETIVNYHIGNYDDWREILFKCLKRCHAYLVRSGVQELPAEAAFIELGAPATEKRQDDLVVVPGERVMNVFEALNIELPPDTEETIQRKFLEPLIECGEMDDGIFEVLDNLAARGVKIGLVSNTAWGTPSAIWHDQLKRLGIYDRFDCVVFDVDVGFRKPHPRIFERFLQSLNVRPEETLFVGDDSLRDVAGAGSLGMKTVLIKRPWHQDNPSARPDFKVAQLDQLVPILDGLFSGEATR